MKRIVPYVFPWLMLWFLTSCHDTLMLPAMHWKRVAVVYMMAENSLSGYAQLDLAEIRSAVGSIPDSCQLVVFMDNSRSDYKPQVITFDARQGEKVIFTYKADPVSTDSTTLQRVLELVVRQCPAEEYGIVMWSHGSGWIPREPRRTIGVDNGQNSYSNLGTELDIAPLAHILQQTGVVWNYVFFDACFMQGIEVAYELRRAAHWCIASPAEIPADGAPYDRLMPLLFLPRDEAWRIAEDYYDYYRDKGGVVISAIATSRLEELADATRPLLARLPAYPATDGVQQYFADAAHGYWKPAFYDMSSAIHQWSSESEYADWLQAFDRAVPHRYASERWETSYPEVDPRITDPGYAGMVSMFIPQEGSRLNEAYAQTAWRKRTNN